MHGPLIRSELGQHIPHIMAETRGGGGAKNAKPKARKTRVVADTSSASPAVTTRAAASAEKAKNAASPAPKAKGKGKKTTGKAKAVEVTAVSVATPPADSESVPTRKKKKRKRVHKRKGSDAGALASVESTEPPTKKQALKKETEATPAKNVVPTAAAAPATPTKSTEGKSTRSRNKKKRGDTKEQEEEEVKMEASKALVDTPQRGRLTRAAAAAAAAQAALQTPQESTAADQSPPSASKSRTRKRRRSRQGRRDSVEPAPAVDDDEVTLQADEKTATETVDEAETTRSTTLSPVKPKSTIISLRKVKGAHPASEPAVEAEYNTSVTTPLEPLGNDEREEEENDSPLSLKETSSPLQLSADERGQEDGESVSAERENPTDVAERDGSDDLDNSALVDELLGEDEHPSVEEMSGDQDGDGGDGEEEQREQSDGVEVNEAVEGDGPIDELEVDALPSVAESSEDEPMELLPEESAGIDSEEIDDDEMVGEADNEIERMEEELGGGQGGVEETEEEDTYGEDAHEDESDEEGFTEPSAAAMEITTRQQVGQASSAEDTESDSDQQRDEELDDSESDSEGEFPAQEAVFSDSEEEEEHRPGLGHHRFLSPPVESEGSSNGAPEVIELSDSDSDSEGDAASDGELQLPSPSRNVEALNVYEYAGHGEEDLEDDADEEEADQDEVDEREEEDSEKEDEEHAGWDENIEEAEAAMPSPTTYGSAVCPESSDVPSRQAGELVEIEESDDDEVDEGGDSVGWGHRTDSLPEDEEAKSEGDTEDEMDPTEDDDSADEQAATQDEEDQEAVNSDEAPDVKGEILTTLGAKLDESEADITPVTSSFKSEEPSEPHDQEPTTSEASTTDNAPESVSVIAYSSTPSKELLESVLAGSPRSTVASLTQDLPTPLLPVRSRPQSRSWGPSFGGASVDTSAPVAAASRPAEASPLSSWFFSKGPANFKKRVVMPRVKESSHYGAGSPRQRLGSPRPTKKARVDTEAEGEEKSATQAGLFAQTWSTQLLDPPLPAAMIKRLGGEKALALFSSSATDLTPITLPTSEDAEVPSNRRLALSTLEEAILEEKKRARAFDQELLLMLQGKTLTGKDLADEFAPLLVGTTK